MHSYLALLLSLVSALADDTPPLVLLVAFDGLLPANITHELMPNLHALAQLDKTVYAKGMRPTFMTVTTTNFAAISTGLYADASGIIDNRFYAPSHAKYDYFGFDADADRKENSLQSSWYSGKPFWHANREAGRSTACFYWPLCNAHFNNQQPPELTRGWEKPGTLQEWKGYVDDVLGTFADGYNFAMLYITEPDHSQHRDELGSESVKETLARVDDLTRYLLDKIDGDTRLRDRLNLVMLSDHGHENMRYDNIYPLLTEKERASFGLSGFSLFPLNSDFNESALYIKLKNFIGEHDFHYRVFRKADFPIDQHWADSDRVGPLIVLPDPGYWPLFEEKNATELAKVVGTHGNLNTDENMHAFFLARGPDILAEHGPITDIFDNVEVYSLVCRLLRVESFCSKQSNATGSLADRIMAPRSLAGKALKKMKNAVEDARSAILDAWTKHDYRVLLLVVFTITLPITALIMYLCRLCCCRRRGMKGPLGMLDQDGGVGYEKLENGSRSERRQPLLVNADSEESDAL